MKFTVGSANLAVSQVGRICVGVNSQTHTVKFVNAATGQDVPGGVASINMAGCTAGQFQYQQLANPLTLTANTPYYIVSLEFSGGDFWYDAGGVASTSDASVNGSAYLSSNNVYTAGGSANSSYVPPNFLYTVVTTTQGPGFIQSFNTGGSLRNNFSGFVGTQLTIGNTALNVTQLGRYCAGNGLILSQTHIVKFADASGNDVPGASASVNTAGCTPGTWVYANASGAATLQPNTTYYLVSQELAGGDYWYDSSTVLTTNVATVNSAVYTSGSKYVSIFPGKNSYVPPNFQYTSGPGPCTGTITVNVGTNPSGLAFSVGGQGYNSNQTFTNWDCSKATIIATTATQPTSAGTQQVFSNWSDGGALSHSVQPGTATTYTANFTTQYLLNLGANPTFGSINLAPTTSTGYYNAGTTVQLTAVPNSGFAFTNFTVDGSTVTTNPLQVTMNAPHTVTANFQAIDIVTAGLVTSVPTSAKPRNDYSGFVGMRIITGANSIPVTALGRYCLQGNSQTHIVKLVSADSGLDVPGATSTVNMNGCTPGTFVYTAPQSAVYLQPATAYFLVSAEVLGGDVWYDLTTVTPNASVPATINSAVYTSNGRYIPIGGPNNSYVPPTLQTSSGTSQTTQVTVNTSPSGLKFTVDGTSYTGSVTLPLLPGSTHIIATTSPQTSASVQQSFTSWSDGGAISHIVTVPTTATATYTATFTTQYQLITGAFPVAGGSVAVSPTSTAGNGFYNAGTVVILTPTANSGYAFTNWTLNGAASGSTASPLSVTMNSAQSVTANFSSAQTTQVTVNTSPSGLTFAVDGTSYTGSTTLALLPGSSHTITTTSPQTSAGIQQIFSSWSGITPPPTISVTAPQSGAVVLTTTTLSATASAGNGVTLTSVQFQLDGQNLGSALTTSPYSMQWNPASGSNGTHTLTAVATDSLGQSTTSNGVAVTVANPGGSSGTTPTSTTPATPVTTAGTTAISLSVTIPATATATYTANFTTQYQLMTSASPAGGGSVAVSPAPDSVNGFYNSGTQVTLIATPASGYTFANWTVNGVTGSTANPLSVTMSSPQTVTANFQLTNTPVPALVTAFSANATVRNDFTGFVGMKILTGGSSIPVTALGRVCLLNNQQLHVVKFVNAGTGVDVPGATATVNMNGCIPGTFVYGAPQSAFSLQPNTAYYLVSAEAANSDTWYDVAPMTPNASIPVTITNGVYSYLGSYNTIASANFSYGPPNFQSSGGSSQTSQVTVTTSPSGLPFTVDGTSYSGSTTLALAQGSIHTIATTTPQNSSGGTQQGFVSWSDGGAISHTITVPAASTATYTATFTTQYQLTTNVSPASSGGVAVSPASAFGSGFYNSGSVVTLTATAASGYTFTNWTINGVTGSTVNPLPVTMNSAQSVTANFAAAQTTQVTVNTSPSGLAFTVDGTPYTGTTSLALVQGSNHSIATTSPQIGTGVQQIFSSWSPGGTTGTLYSFAVPASAITYTANFTTQYQLTTNVNPAGSGSVSASTVSNSGFYNSGAVVTLTATPASGYTFNNWTINGATGNTANPLSVTMNAPQSVTANFTQSSITNSNFVSSYTKANLRNNFTGFLGMQITVGSSNLSVGGVGRVCVSGNTGSHIVKFVLATSNADVPGGSAVVNMSNCTPGQFVYSSVAIVLQANTKYYVVSQETSNGDQWYDQGAVIATNVATVNASVYQSGSGYATASAGSSYVLPDFQYSVLPTQPQFITAYGSTTTRSDFGGFVGMDLTIGPANLTVTQIGRVCVVGNSQTHLVEFVDPGNSNAVVGSASVNMNGCTPGLFVYAAPIGGTFTLSSGRTYHLASQETAGGDKWYDLAPVTSTTAASVRNGVFQSSSGSWVTSGAGSYVPPNFTYAVAAPTAAPTSLVAPAAASTLLVAPVATPTLTVIPARAPDALSSPSFTAWSANAIAALSGLSPAGATPSATDPAAFFKVNQETAYQSIVTPFNSWLGSASAATGAFANEYGNRLHFALHVNGNGSQFSLSQLSYDLESTDPNRTFHVMGGFGSTDSYSPQRVGLIHSTNALVTSGPATQLVDEIFYVGLGAAIEPSDLGCNGSTNQALVNCVATYYDSINPFNVSIVYTLNGATGTATVPFVSGGSTGSSATIDLLSVQPSANIRPTTTSDLSNTQKPQNLQIYK